MPAQQLCDFTNELARVWGNELLRAQPLTSWEAALTAVAQYVGGERTLVVLDEFQLLAARSPELETTISRWWRTTGRELPKALVLAGSELSFFEDKVFAGSLYGRRTGQLKLEPFTARDAALFHPGYSDEDKVRAYSVCGGIPYYLERFSDSKPIAEGLLTEVFERTGLLHDEAELMLRQSIPDPSNHIAVLRSIAHGYNRNNQIADRLGAPGTGSSCFEGMGAGLPAARAPRSDGRNGGRALVGQVPAGDGRRTEEREVDVVGIDGSGNTLAIGMCKWTGREVDFDELNLLERLAPHIGGVTAATSRYLFSRNGFSRRLAAHAAAEPSLHLVTPADIYSREAS